MSVDLLWHQLEEIYIGDCYFQLDGFTTHIIPQHTKLLRYSFQLDKLQVMVT